MILNIFYQTLIQNRDNQPQYLKSREQEAETDSDVPHQENQDTPNDYPDIVYYKDMDLEQYLRHNIPI